MFRRGSQAAATSQAAKLAAAATTAAFLPNWYAAAPARSFLSGAVRSRLPTIPARMTPRGPCGAGRPGGLVTSATGAPAADAAGDSPSEGSGGVGASVVDAPGAAWKPPSEGSAGVSSSVADAKRLLEEQRTALRNVPIERVYPTSSVVSTHKNMNPEGTPKMNYTQQTAAIRTFIQADDAKQARTSVMTACGNDAKELQRLANMCLQVPDGFPVAKNIFLIAMEEGNDSAGVSYAILLCRGPPTDVVTMKRNRKEAYEIFVRLSRKGHPHAQFELSDFFWQEAMQRETGTWSDDNGASLSSERQAELAKKCVEHSMELLELAGRGGVSRAFCILGRSGALTGLVDLACCRSSDLPNVTHCGPTPFGEMVLRAGQRYRSGSNVPRDMVKAGEFFRKAIEKNPDPNAYFYLADMHSKGDGVEKDEQQAFELLRAATTYGIPEAQHNVAVRYIEGLGCEKDNAMAISYLEMAAMQGYQPSMINLAKHYSEGAIVDFDEGKARHLFQSVVDREPPFSPFSVAAQDGLKHLEALKDSGAAPARSLSKKMRGGGSLCVMM